MFFNTLIGCIIFLITNSSLLYAAHLIVRRFLPDVPASVRLVATGTFFYSLIIVLFQALSPFHAITKVCVTVSCVFIAMLVHLSWGSLRNFKDDIEPVKLWIRDGLNSRWAVLLIICGFVVLLSFSRALLMPPLAWDCLTYHLTYATLLIKKGAISLFTAPDQLAYTALFPINGELFACWLLLPFGSDLLVNTMNFPIMLLGGISCYAIARELGLSRKEASFAPALICFAPFIYTLITTEYLDIATFAFCSVSVLFTLRYLRRGNFYDFCLALAAAGVLLGLKYNGIPAAGLIFTAISIKTIRVTDNTRFSRKMSMIFLGLVIMCALGGRQYIFNSLEAANPLYPFQVKISNYEIFKGSLYLEKIEGWLNDYEKTHNWDKFSLWEKEYRKFCYLSMTAGPKFLVFLIIAGISLFWKPRNLSKGVWIFFNVFWIVPIVLFYTNSTADFARRAYWTDGSFRFLSPYIALFTIQSLVFIKRVNRYPRGIDFMFTALITWDLLYSKKKSSVGNNHIIPNYCIADSHNYTAPQFAAGKVKVSFCPKENSLELPRIV